MRARDLGCRVRGAAARHPSWMEWLTRVGYAAKGVVYLLIGGTALLVAVGLAERARGSSEAIALVSGLPMGRLPLGALTVGLLGYSLLSFVAAVRAPEGTSGLAGAVTRVGDALAGVVYAALAALAVRLLADPAASPAVAGEVWAGRLLAMPGGRALLGAAGVATVGAAVYLAYKAAVLPVAGQLERRRVSKAVVRVVGRLARLGIGARAILFALCGWLFVRASWTGQPRRIGGLGDALDALGDAPAGPAVVATVGAGCLAYGMYQLAKARWRRLRLGAPEES